MDAAFLRLMKLLISDFRCCAFCKCLGLKSSTLCSYCFSLLLDSINRADTFKKGEEPFTKYALFDWTEHSLLIGSLIKASKGGWNCSTYENLASHFVSQRWNFSWPQYERILIYSAPRKHRRFDHSAKWARGLAKQVGGVLMDQSFIKISQGDQKAKKRLSRLEMQFSYKGPRLRSRDFVIFADDILTTGSTAKAVWQALSFPPLFEVWTVAYRPSFMDLSEGLLQKLSLSTGLMKRSCEQSFKG